MTKDLNTDILKIDIEYEVYSTGVGMNNIIYSLTLLLLFSGSAAAAVCEKRAGLTESFEDSISNNGFELNFESMIIKKDDGSTWSVYCIKNDATSKYAYVKWNGPGPNVLFDDFVAAGPISSSKAYKTFGVYDREKRRIEYGYSRVYGYQEDVYTWKRLSYNPSKLLPLQVQISPLQSLGLTFQNALQEGSSFEQYLESYYKSPEGGRYITFESISETWIPASKSELEALAAGSAMTRSSVALVPVTFIARSRIDTAEKTYTWELQLSMLPGAAKLLAEVSILDDLSVGISDQPYDGLEGFKPFQVLPAKEFSGSLLESRPASIAGDLQKVVFDGSEEIQEWSVALEYNGKAFSGMTHFQFGN